MEKNRDENHYHADNGRRFFVETHFFSLPAVLEMNENPQSKHHQTKMAPAFS